MSNRWLTFMGSFVADLTFEADRLPGWEQTVLGGGFRLGPGGKGSNQAVAAARLGSQVCFIGRVGTDAFGDLARKTWQDEGIDTSYCSATSAHGTGAAAVVIDRGRGENAIVVDPGSGMHLSVEDVERAQPRLAESVVFVTQLENRRKWIWWTPRGSRAGSPGFRSRGRARRRRCPGATNCRGRPGGGATIHGPAPGRPYIIRPTSKVPRYPPPSIAVRSSLSCCPPRR